MLNSKEKVAFIGNPRAATTSIKNIIVSRGFNCTYWHDPIQFYVDTLHEPTDVKYFIVVRNPWDRFVSWWSHHRRHNHKFVLKYKHFIDWILSGEYHKWDDYDYRRGGKKSGRGGDPRENMVEYWQRHSPLIQYHFIKNDRKINPYILKFENLDNDWKNIFCKNVNGFGNVHLGRTNETSRLHYKYYYNEEAKNVIAEYCKEDIENFGYKYDESSTRIFWTT